MVGDFNFNNVNPYSNILEFQDFETLSNVAAPEGGGYSPEGGSGNGGYGGGYGGSGGYGGGGYGGGSSNGGGTVPTSGGSVGTGSNSNSPAANNTIAISPTNSVQTTQSATAMMPTTILSNQVVRPSEIERLDERLAKMKRANSLPSLANRSRSTGPEEKQSMFASVFAPIIKVVPAPIAQFLSNPAIQGAIVVGCGSAAALLILHLLSKRKGGRKL